MPTRAGAGLTLGGGAILAAGVVLGLVELFLLGVAALAAVAAAGLVVATRPRAMEVTRTVAPDRLPAGGAATVTVVVTNRSRRRSPVLLLRDRVGTDADARILVPPLRRDAATTEEWSLPVRRRGRLRVGPLTAVVGDPFGLVERRRIVADHLDVLVHPELTPLPAIERISADASSSAGTSRPARSGPPTFELYGLRDYVRGDDLRRVHWPTSARFGRLMIREDEEHPAERTLVVLDTAGRDADADELAVSVAASVLVSVAAVGHHVRLLTGDAFDSGWGDEEALLSSLDHLADHRSAPCEPPPPAPGVDVIAVTSRPDRAIRAGLVIATTGTDDRGGGIGTGSPTRLRVASLADLRQAWAAAATTGAASLDTVP